jgi:hypothetical protein
LHLNVFEQPARKRVFNSLGVRIMVVSLRRSRISSMGKRDSDKGDRGRAIGRRNPYAMCLGA